MSYTRNNVCNVEFHVFPQKFYILTVVLNSLRKRSFMRGHKVFYRYCYVLLFLKLGITYKYVYFKSFSDNSHSLRLYTFIRFELYRFINHLPYLERCFNTINDHQNTVKLLILKDPQNFQKKHVCLRPSERLTSHLQGHLVVDLFFLSRVLYENTFLERLYVLCDVVQ
jgi:hypothetical protein